MELRRRDLGYFFGQDLAKDLIFVSENDGWDLLNDAEIFFGCEGEKRDERVKFSVADDVMPNFRDSIGLIF